ncbi:unnamed protein product [Polarella glacialis]|uniref:Uncharacterized protein n=1 Tax=Polarella glacialis TaxID=89957 RepID=A0A813LV99_POLGL|nr:unnamed protein product [Polarella glacialis]
MLETIQTDISYQPRYQLTCILLGSEQTEGSCESVVGQNDPSFFAKRACEAGQHCEPGHVSFDACYQGPCAMHNHGTPVSMFRWGECGCEAACNEAEDCAGFTLIYGDLGVLCIFNGNDCLELPGAAPLPPSGAAPLPSGPGAPIFLRKANCIQIPTTTTTTTSTSR